jgi:phosphate-selective porin OprO/OprP
MIEAELRVLCAVVWLALLPGNLQAQTALPAQTSEAASGPSTYETIWQAFSEWYENDANPVIQSVVFSGRYQHDFAAVDAEQGDHDEWNVRRMRLGARVRMYRRLLVHVEGDFDPQENDPFYLRLTDAYVQWTRNSGLVVALGKQGAPFTLEGATSSKELLAIDRSNLANNLWFPQEYVPGVSVSGRRHAWVYRAGVYSAGEANREFGEFNGGFFTLGVVGYDFAKPLGVKQALLSGNYVYQDPDRRNTFTRRLHHVGSINFKLDQPTWGVHADLTAGAGYLGQSNLWGLIAMPYLYLTERLQIATRYTLLDSSDANGIQLATYENRVVDGRGDRYQDGYAGINYYFYGHKLKLQTGLQYGDMNDSAGDGGAYSGLSWTAGIRVGWP